MKKCREYAKEHNIAIVGKLKRVKNNLGYVLSDIKIYADEDGNEVWVAADGVVFVDKNGGCI